MAETIESFVEKLQKEGVEAGRREAQQVLADAKVQADKILADAKAQAEQILADADEQAQKARDRSETELRLSARDTVLRLRDALNRAVQAVLARAANAQLQDVGFLAPLLHDIVMRYAQADCERKGRIQIDLEPEMRQKLTDWALRELGQERAERMRGEIDLKGTLQQAGFEYSVGAGTVEVTLDSVVETLRQMVAPEVAALVDQAVAEGGPAEGGET